MCAGWCALRGSWGWGLAWVLPSSSPPSCSALCITSCNGDGRKYKPPPAAPSSIRAADSIESCRNGSPCPGSIQGNIHYPKTKTRGVHSWGPTLQIPLPPSLPLLLLLHSMCAAAIYTVSPPKHPQCPTLRHWDLQGWCCVGILKAEVIQGLDLHWQRNHMPLLPTKKRLYSLWKVTAAGIASGPL